MKIEKVNESYSTIESDDKSVLMNISNYLKAERSMRITDYTFRTA